MREIVVVPLALALALGCGDGEIPEGSGGSEPAGSALIVEVLHAGIIAPTLAASRDRVPALIAQLSATPADIVCLEGVWDAGVRGEIVEALRPVFPQAVDLRTGDGSTVDPIPDRELPEPAAGAPCSSLLVPAVRNITGCVAAACATRDGEDQVLRDPSCLREGGLCAVPSGGLVDRVDGARCATCVAAHLLAGEDTAATLERCTTVEGAPLVFAGDSGVVILSRAPVQAIDQRVLPSTWRRRVLVHARLGHEDGPLDVVCASLTPAAPTGLAADPSDLGADVDGFSRGLEEENALQADALLAFVDGLGGANPTIVLGSFGTSAPVLAGGGQVIAGFGESVDAALSARLSLAVDPSRAPECTVCPDNPLVDASAPPSLMNRVYLGAGGLSVEAVERVYLGRVATIGEPTMDRPFRHVPSVAQYATRATLRLPSR